MTSLFISMPMQQSIFTKTQFYNHQPPKFISTEINRPADANYISRNSGHPRISLSLSLFSPPNKKERSNVSVTGYKKAEVGGLNAKHSNGGSLDRYTADPNARGAQAGRADIIRPRPTPCKQLLPATLGGHHHHHHLAAAAAVVVVNAANVAPLQQATMASAGRKAVHGCSPSSVGHPACVYRCCLVAAYTFFSLFWVFFLFVFGRVGNIWKACRDSWIIYFTQMTRLR